MRHNAVNAGPTGPSMTTPATTRHDISRGQLAALMWSLVAAAPFLAFPLIHQQRLGDTATGFTTYDLPYYVANARAILDRGVGPCYPNPFDPDAAAPAIYVHWLMLGLAVMIGPLGLSPGTALLVVQAAGAITSARVMYALVSWLRPHSRWHVMLYLLAMWSGGVLALGKVLSNLVVGAAWDWQLLALDPGQGLWCLNFGRNLILPTEAVYHALMLGLWLAILQSRWRTAGILLIAIATTHPFTGAQALAIVGAFAVISRLMPAGAPVPPGFLVAFGLTAASFAAYYFGFLPRFPQHREIQHTWTLGWTLSGPTILLAYAPAAVLAWLAIRRDRAWRREVRFLAVAAGVSFLLANHQWFLTPRQPIHFTRGYIWTPLFLAGLPTIERVLDWLQTRLRAAAPLALIALAALAVSDNAAFLLINATSAVPPGFALTADERAMFDELNDRQADAVLLTDDDRLGYLAAAMTRVRPWIGHKYNTPKFDERQNRLAVFKSTSAGGDLLNEVGLAITADPRVVRRLQDDDWQKLTAHGDLQLWMKPVQ